MKLTVAQMLDVSASLDYLGQKENLLCAYQVAKNITKFKKLVDKYKNDKKQLIGKYVQRDEDGSYKLTEDGMDYYFGSNTIKFNEAVDNLRSEEIEVKIHCILKADLLIEGKAIIPPANILAVLDEVILVEEITMR